MTGNPVKFKYGKPVKAAINNKLHYSLYKNSTQLYTEITAVRVGEFKFILLLNDIPMFQNGRIFIANLDGIVIPDKATQVKMQARNVTSTLIRLQAGFNPVTGNVQWECDLHNPEFTNIVNLLCMDAKVDQDFNITVMGGIN